MPSVMVCVASARSRFSAMVESSISIAFVTSALVMSGA